MGSVDNNSRYSRAEPPLAREQCEQLPQRSESVHRDLDLVRRLLARNEAAWSEFVATYRRLFVSRINATAAELNMAAPGTDLTDEISAEVFSLLLSDEMDSLRQFSGRSRLSTWLTVVVRRTSLRFFARAARRPRQPDTAELDCLPGGDQSVDNKQPDRLQQVTQAMQRLSEDDRRLMTMFYDKQLSYDQIARTLGISRNTVGPKLDRVRRRLRTILERQAANQEQLDE